MRVAFLFATLALACAIPLKGGNSNIVRVTLRVFSGVTDPSWTTELPSEIENSCNVVLRTYYPVLGYRGFVIQHANGATTEVMGCLSLERVLLASAASASVDAQVLDYVQQQLVKLSQADPNQIGPIPISPVTFPENSIGEPAGTVVGPDTPVKYDPAHDDQGYFQTHCSQNNCYNYGTDVATNTFAQPGRGSGHKWQQNNCENINASAIFDGLEWMGTQLPTAQPTVGHYVALYIWPNVNFHWARMDDNMMWSHKPGQTPVRNIDNNGQIISDPSKADLSPWSTFCGYMHVVPSRINIS